MEELIKRLNAETDTLKLAIGFLIAALRERQVLDDDALNAWHARVTRTLAPEQISHAETALAEILAVAKSPSRDPS